MVAPPREIWNCIFSGLQQLDERLEQLGIAAIMQADDQNSATAQDTPLKYCTTAWSGHHTWACFQRLCLIRIRYIFRIVIIKLTIKSSNNRVMLIRRHKDCFESRTVFTPCSKTLTGALIACCTGEDGWIVVPFVGSRAWEVVGEEPPDELLPLPEFSAVDEPLRLDGVFGFDGCTGLVGVL